MHPSTTATARTAVPTSRPGTNPLVLEIRSLDPGRTLCLRVAGMEADLYVQPVRGRLAVTPTQDGGRDIQCPLCGNGDSLVNQEWVYASRRVTTPTLRRVDDPDSGTLWFLSVSADHDGDGAYDVAGALAAPFFCRFCGNGFTLPPSVHVDIRWDEETTVEPVPPCHRTENGA